MQNILNEIQTGNITHNDLLNKLLAHESKSVDEYNELMDALEERNAKLEEQSFILQKQNEALQVQDKNKSTLLLNEQSLKQQSVAFQLECKNLKHKLEVLTNEAKAAREQTKRNKAAIKMRDDKIARLEKAKPAATAIQEMKTIYSKGTDVLLIYPSRLTIEIDGKPQQQVTLLFTNRKGCFTTAFLDKEDKVAFSTFINDVSAISEQTRKLINKNCMQISEEAAEFAQSWLYRINRVQSMKLNTIDFTCFNDLENENDR